MNLLEFRVKKEDICDCAHRDCVVIVSAKYVRGWGKLFVWAALFWLLFWISVRSRSNGIWLVGVACVVGLACVVIKVDIVDCFTERGRCPGEIAGTCDGVAVRGSWACRCVKARRVVVVLFGMLVLIAPYWQFLLTVFMALFKNTFTVIKLQILWSPIIHFKCLTGLVNKWYLEVQLEWRLRLEDSFCVMKIKFHLSPNSILSIHICIILVY